MNNEMIILIGICAIVFCLVLFAIAVFVFTGRVVKAFQTMWNKQIETWAEIDKSQELMMKFMLEFAKVQTETIEELKARVEESHMAFVAASGDGDSPEETIKAIQPGKLEKGSKEAKERMAKIRPDNPPKGSPEAKEKMAKVRAAKEAKK